jgi:hypothetical protein
MEEKFKIHAFYILLILVTIIILLLTIKWSNNIELVNHIAFAATLASLLLSVLAIVYAYLYNASFAGNLSKVNDASKNLSENANKLCTASENIIKELGPLPSLTQKIYDKMGEWPTALPSASHKEKVDQTSTNKGNDICVPLETLLTKSSLSGKFLFLMVYLSYKTKKAFSLVDLSAKLNLDSTYFQGYIIASSSVGLFRFTETNNIYNIVEVNPIFEKAHLNIKDRIMKQADNIGKLNKWPDLAGKIKTSVSLIDEYFTGT